MELETEDIPVPRFAVYETWRRAVGALLALRNVVVNGAPEGKALATSVSAFADAARKVHRYLPVSVRSGMSDFVEPQLPAFDRELMAVLAGIEAELGRLVRNEWPVFLGYLRDFAPLEQERAVLKAAIYIDTNEAKNGSPVEVKRVSERAKLTTSAVRRVLCQWLDEGLVYLHGDMESVDGDEGFVLNEDAEQRWDEWDDYVEERRKMRVKTIEIAYADQLPPNYDRIVHEVSVTYEIEVSRNGVVPTETGIRVVATLPEGWTHDDQRLDEYASTVQKRLRTPRVMPASAQSSVNFHGDVIGSAVQAASPGATQNVQANIDIGTIRDVFTAAKDALASTDLDEDTREIVDAQILAIDKQLGKANPNPKLLRPMIVTIATALGTAGAAGQGVEYVHKLLQLLGVG